MRERIENIQSEVLQQKGVYDILNRNLSDLEKRRDLLEKDRALLEKVHIVLSTLVLSTEKNIAEYISPVVTEALHYVFEQDLKFCIEFVVRRNQIEIDFFILRSKEEENILHEYMIDPEGNEKEIQDIIKSHKDINFMYGGAVNQVVGLVLRLVLAEYLKIKGPIFLDEPSSAVGDVYTERLGKLIDSLSKRFNRQIVLITHSYTLASFAEKQYFVSRENNISRVEERL